MLEEHFRWRVGATTATLAPRTSGRLLHRSSTETVLKTSRQRRAGASLASQTFYCYVRLLCCQNWLQSIQETQPCRTQPCRNSSVLKYVVWLKDFLFWFVFQHIITYPCWKKTWLMYKIGSETSWPPLSLYLYSPLKPSQQTLLPRNTYLLLAEDLHSIMLLCFFVFYQHNTAKWARAQSFQPLKMFQASCVLNTRKIS